MSAECLAIVFVLLAACPLAYIGSKFIDVLYRAAPTILSYPQEVAARARWRLALLAVAWGACALAAISFAAEKAGGLPLPFLLGAIWFLLLATATDLEQQVIFDKMLLPFALLGLMALPHQGGSPGDYFLAAFLGGLGFLLLAIATRGAIGGGDIKLIAALGLWLGTEKLLAVVMAGLVLGGAAALVMLLAKMKTAHSYFAYGPYFALTAIYFFLR